MKTQKIEVGKAFGHLFVEEVEETEIQPLLPPEVKNKSVEAHTEVQLKAISGQGGTNKIDPLLPTFMNRKVAADAEPKSGEKPPPDILLPTGMNR